MKTTKIRQSARGEVCTFQLPGICNHDPETTTLCHAPHIDKGMGIKGPDTWAAYGCSACHDEMDRRTMLFFKGPGHKNLDDNNEMRWRIYTWHNAICETQRRLIKKGLMPK